MEESVLGEASTYTLNMGYDSLPAAEIRDYWWNARYYLTLLSPAFLPPLQSIVVVALFFTAIVANLWLSFE